MPKLITEQTVLDAAKRGETTLAAGTGTIVTDAARDRARQLAVAVLVYEISRARNAGQAVGPLDAVRLLNQGALLLDVRSKAEFDSGHVIDARHVPQEDLAASSESLKKYREKAVIACCETGTRSSAASRVLTRCAPCLLSARKSTSPSKVTGFLRWK